ncbi:MAG TPA: hypothetical protein VGA70_03840 [Longimicrobiales bacterium]
MIEKLPAYLLDLMEPEERARIQDALAGDASLREALEAIRGAAEGWREGDHPSEEDLRTLASGSGSAAAASTLEHLLACRDCRFVAAVVLSEPGEQDAAVEVGGGRPRGRWIGPALGLAAGIGIGILGPWLGLRSEPSPAVTRSVVLDLRGERGAMQQPSAELRGVDGITLQVETVLPAGSSRWRLVGRAGREVASGELVFPPEGPTLRVVALHVPAARLQSGNHVLHFRSEDGSADRQWSFRVR